MIWATQPLRVLSVRERCNIGYLAGPQWLLLAHQLGPSNQLGREQWCTCWPRTIGPAQREHTIGGKLLSGFVCLRRVPRRTGVSCVGSNIVVASINPEKAPTDSKEMMTERSHRDVNCEGVMKTPRGAHAKIIACATISRRMSKKYWPSALGIYAPTRIAGNLPPVRWTIPRRQSISGLPPTLQQRLLVVRASTIP